MSKERAEGSVSVVALQPHTPGASERQSTGSAKRLMAAANLPGRTLKGLSTKSRRQQRRAHSRRNVDNANCRQELTTRTEGRTLVL